MKYTANVRVTNGAVGVDPITTPEGVLDEHIMRFPERAPLSDRQCRRLLFTFHGVAAETVTVSLYALDEGTVPDRSSGVQLVEALKGDRRFTLFQAGLVITSGEMAASIENAGPPGGPVYVRVTAESIAADRVILGSCADS